MEILKVQLFFMNNNKKKYTKRAVKRTPEFPKKISRRQTDGELTKNFTFSNFFENRMLAGANSF